jgi:hypothetical protein
MIQSPSLRTRDWLGLSDVVREQGRKAWRVGGRDGERMGKCLRGEQFNVQLNCRHQRRRKHLAPTDSDGWFRLGVAGTISHCHRLAFGTTFESLPDHNVQ